MDEGLDQDLPVGAERGEIAEPDGNADALTADPVPKDGISDGDRPAEPWHVLSSEASEVRQEGARRPIERVKASPAATIDRAAAWWARASTARRAGAGAVGGVLILTLVAGLALAAGGSTTPSAAHTPIAAATTTLPSLIAVSGGATIAVSPATHVPLTGAAPCEQAFHAAPYTPVPVATPTAEPTVTPTPTETPTPTVEPTLTPTAAPTPTPSPTASQTPTAAPTPKPTPTASASDASTGTAFLTDTPAPTATSLATAIPGAVARTVELDRKSSASSPARPDLAPWRAGGDAKLLLAGDIVSTPSGYLATLKFSSAYALCWSPNLVDWYPPDAAHFVNNARAPFYPVGAVEVKKGYAASVVQDPDAFEEHAKTTEWDPKDIVDWYSPDGLSWSPGIPAAVLAAPPVMKDERCAPDDVYGDPKCIYAGSLVLSVDGSAVSRDGGKTWARPSFPAKVMLEQFFDLQRLADKSYVARAVVRDTNWTPPPCDRCTVPDEAGNYDSLLASKDGLKWRQIEFDGGSMLARPEGLYVADSQGVSLSKDDGATWTQVERFATSVRGYLCLAGDLPVVVEPAENFGSLVTILRVGT